MNNLIQWPRAQYWDKPWNPIVGCRKCSPACEHCYAESMMRRFGAADFSPRPTTRIYPPRSGVVFCGNMTDLFGEWLWPNKGCCTVRNSVDFFRWTTSGISKIGEYKNTTFLWLTKRVAAMCDALGHYAMPSNHYFGFTAENQEWYDKRHLDVIGKPIGMPKWAQWWVSCEPLLGRIHLWMPPAFRAPSWLVVGCESGPNRRPCKIEWVESIVEQCFAANVPVFVKQLDIGGKCVTDINKFPKHLQIRQVPWANEGGAK